MDNENNNEFEDEFEEEKVAPGKSSDKKTKPTLRANVGIMMQNELLADMLTTLEEIKSYRNLSKTALVTYKSAADADLENSNKYNKTILGSTRLTTAEIEEYTKARTHKHIKDTYWKIIMVITDQLGVDNESQGACGSSKKCNDADNFRLPRLDLPTFSGKYDEWLPFNNLFTSSVDSRSNIDPVEKLYYLMKSVTGDAYNQIKNLSLTNENYIKAKEILEEQYNHTRKVAHTYMKKLLDCKPMQTENAKDLRFFISNTKDCLISLKNLGLPTDNWDYILLYNLQTKIPSTTFLKWEEEFRIFKRDS